MVHLGGSLLGGLIYHADIATGQTHFLRAIMLDPGNLLIPYQFALSLAAYDFDAAKEHVSSLLDSVSIAQPRDAYETAVQARAKELAELLKKKDSAAFVARVARFQGYP